MATPSQVAANQRNAQKSTGPKTPEGKAASRGNAVKHGLAGEGVALGAGPEVADRRDAWGGDSGGDGRAAWALNRLVAASFQIERCEEAMMAVCVAEPEHARLGWDDRKYAECEALLARIGRAPGPVAATLEGSLHGVAVLLKSWGRLVEALDDGGDWSEVEASMALNLLGVPAAFREGRTALDPPTGVDRTGHLKALAAGEVARLEGKCDDLGTLDLLDRKMAIGGVTTLLSAPARLILRYEREAWRRFREADRVVVAARTRDEDTARSSAPVPPRVPSPPDRVAPKPVAPLRPVTAEAFPLPLGETNPIPRRGAAPTRGARAPIASLIGGDVLDFTVGNGPVRR